MTKTKSGLKLAILGLAAAIVLMGGFTFYLLAPSQYLALDVNPSIEFHTNRLGRVVSMAGANEDARVLLAGYQGDGKKLDEVLEQVVTRMIDSGYIAEGKTNDILITSEKGAAADKTLKDVSQKVQQELTKHELTGEILTQSIALSPVAEKAAAEHQVSAGKMAVIDQLVKQDAALKPEALADTRISDLLAYAEKNNISLDTLEDNLEALQDAGGDNAHLEALEEAVDDAQDIAEDAEDEKADAEEKAKDAAEEAAEKAEEEKEDAEEKAKEAAEDAKDAEDDAKDAADDAKDAEDDAKDAAEDAAEDAKDAEDDAKDAAEKDD